ncbi:hypothetical protein AOLI_G00256230 [Acnodon oligacanthus]
MSLSGFIRFLRHSLRRLESSCVDAAGLGRSLGPALAVHGPSLLPQPQHIGDHNSVPSFLDSIFWMAAPKKRRTIEVNRCRRRNPNKLIEVKTNIEPCPECGNLKQKHALCGFCYEKVQKETALIRKQIQTMEGRPLNAPSVETVVLYENEAPADADKNKRIVELFKGVSMNNLNDPPRWNIRPDPHGGADGSKWNYALLVPMLGLAAFRWIWTRESQRQIQEIKVQYDRDMATLARDLELKYKDTLTENRRTAALLELELEKERQRVQGYRKALVSQSQQLLEERKQLQKEREELEKEKRRALQSGAAGIALNGALQREEQWHQRATALLQELELQLVERQEAFCSLLVPRERRLEMEKNLLLKVAKDPVGAELGLEEDLRDIFKNDRHCADLLNMDKKKNGKLMWLYLRYWQLQVTLQKHKRAEDALKGTMGNVKCP